MSVTRLGPGGYPVASGVTLRNLTLQAAAGSYTITGSSASLVVGHIVKASAGSYSVTGSSAALLEGHVLKASPGSYSITGVSASLVVGHVVKASLGSYTISGASANLVKAGALVLQAAPGAYTVTGAAANLVYTSIVVKRDIDAVLTKEQLYALRRRLAEEKRRRKRDLVREHESRHELRSMLESFFEVASPEEAEEIIEALPTLPAPVGDMPKPLPFRPVEIDWRQFYQNRALMQRTIDDLSAMLAAHERKRAFEADEDDALMLMLS